jgi:hypothetical protein
MSITKAPLPAQRIHYLIVFLFFFAPPIFTAAQQNSHTQDQSQDSSLRAARNETLKNLRDFRDQVGTAQNSPPFDTLLQHLSAMIGLIKNATGKAGILLVNEYVSLARSSFHTARDAHQRQLIAANIDRDIELKLYSKPDTTLSFETISGFGTRYDLKVNVYINGRKPGQEPFRVYWSTFLGASQECMIEADKFEGSSDKFTNPCTLRDVLLPGFITFWLKESNNSHVYKSDFTYKELEGAKATLDINFVKLK